MGGGCNFYRIVADRKKSKSTIFKKKSSERSIEFLSIKNCSRCYEYVLALVCNFLDSNSSLKYLSFLEFLDWIDVKL